MTVRASAFGATADGSGDDGPALRAALAAAQEAGPGARLVLEPGRYLVRTGEHGVALPVAGAKGLSIEAEGATIVVG